MKTITKKVYLLVRPDSGLETVSTSDLSQGWPDYILLSTQEVEFTVEKTDADLVREQIEGLEKTKTNVRADAQREIMRLDEKIQSLLAITHSP